MAYRESSSPAESAINPQRIPPQERLDLSSVPSAVTARGQSSNSSLVGFGLVVLVCGGREYLDRDRLFSILDALNAWQRFGRLVHGGARGADSLADEWWIIRKPEGCALKSYPAQWKTYGRKAGLMRNQQMLDSERIDLVVAFPGGRGTADMVERAAKAGIEVVRVYA